MTGGRGPDDADATQPVEPVDGGDAGDAGLGESTQPVDLGESTQPVDFGESTQPVDVGGPPTGAFARTTPPSRPIDLVSSTAANMLLADAQPPTAAPEPAVPDPTSGLDTLFGDAQFRDYEQAPPAEPVRAGPPPTSRPPASRPSGSGPPAPPRSPAEHHLTATQRLLLAVTGGLLALVALAGLFFVGTRLAAAPDPAPTASRVATPKPTPLPTVLPPGPVAVGSHRWDRLLGGECLGAYPGPWARSYTVVDCAAAHPAQLVYRGRFPDPATPGYPGEAALQAQMSVLCSAPGVIDLAAASQYRDAQIQASYPATAAQWDAGDHWYYCFVSRSSKEPLTGSVAVAHTDAPPASG